MPLIKDGKIVQDPWTEAAAGGPLPEVDALLVPYEVWKEERETLMKRNGRFGVRLAADQPPQLIAGDLDRLDLVALEFPTFRDGRAYSYARLLRLQEGAARRRQRAARPVPVHAPLRHRRLRGRRREGGGRLDPRAEGDLGRLPAGNGPAAVDPGAAPPRAGRTQQPSFAFFVRRRRILLGLLSPTERGRSIFHRSGCGAASSRLSRTADSRYSPLVDGSPRGVKRERGAVRLLSGSEPKPWLLPQL